MGGDPTGVKLGSLVSRTSVESGTLRSRLLAVDVANVIYRHFFQIRDSAGSPYRNEQGRAIGHLIGLCHEISLLYGLGIEPIFVLDGGTPVLKEETMRRRKAHDRGFRIDREMKCEMTRALSLLGVPFVQAPEEAEAQAAYMTSRDCWAVVTNDYDALLFGAPRMIRSITRRRTEICSLCPAIGPSAEARGLLIAVGVLIGTDYNPGGIRGIGPKRALELVMKYRSLESVLRHLGEKDATVERFLSVERYYSDPPICDSWVAGRSPPDAGGSRRFLLGEMSLDPKMVEDLLQLLSIRDKASTQTTLAA